MDISYDMGYLADIESFGAVELLFSRYIYDPPGGLKNALISLSDFILTSSPFMLAVYGLMSNRLNS